MRQTDRQTDGRTDGHKDAMSTATLTDHQTSLSGTSMCPKRFTVLAITSTEVLSLVICVYYDVCEFVCNNASMICL